MAGRLKYFLMNKELDFIRGCAYNIIWEDGYMKLLNKEEKGFYFSRIFDSQEKERIWHRMVVEQNAIGEKSICMTLYTAEKKEILIENKRVSLSEFLMDSKIPPEEKKEKIYPYLRREIYSQKELLLHDCKGRYFWFVLELKGQGNMSPTIGKVKIEFPKQTLLNYLPEIYQEQKESRSFVERFLLLFDSLYQDMTRQIEQSPAYFDPDSTKKEMLLWLAKWLSIDDAYIWNEKQLRYLLNHALELYRQRGTILYLKELIALYTGKEAHIVEYHQYEKYLNKQGIGKVLMELYGNNSYIFTIILASDSIRSNQEYSILLKIIDSAKPVHMEGKLVVLRPYILLDKYSYLGVNSMLGQYEPIKLDGSVSVPFTTIAD